MAARKKHKIINGVEHKKCGRCKQWTRVNNFNKHKRNWDGLQGDCKSCRTKYQKQWRLDNSEQIKKYSNQYYIDNIEKEKQRGKQYRIKNVEKEKQRGKQYRINNIEKIKQKSKKWYLDNINTIEQYRLDNIKKTKNYNKKHYIDNAEKRKQQSKEYNNQHALYKTFSHQLVFCEKTRQAQYNKKLLEVKCAYCGRWLCPTNKQAKHRIETINGKCGGENRFYCSENCKVACPTYRQVKYQKNFKKSTSREVVPLLRQLVLERDDYTCQKCGATTKTAPLHVHHILSYKLNKIVANDPDNCITLCKECHKEVHSQDGCRYTDLKCKKET